MKLRYPLPENDPETDPVSAAFFWRSKADSLLKVDIVPDYNRDGKIDLKDRNKITDTNPFRWWFNDDDDVGEVHNDDVPGRGNDADANDGYVGRVDGMRDLVDFFPLYFDLENLFEAVDPSRVKLKLSGQGLRFLEYSDGYAGFEPEEADKFLKDITVARALADADTGAAILDPNSGNPRDLGQHFVNLASQGKGVLLMEAYSLPYDPNTGTSEQAELKLHVFVDDNELFTYDFNVSTSPVEHMMEHHDLTAYAKNYDGTVATGKGSLYDGNLNWGVPATWNTSNWPDNMTNGKTFVFVHGYGVSQNRSRGWQAEVFKRMHQLGSNARFVGVTWNGDTGKDYHKAVYQALQTGDAFGSISYSGDVTAAGHSAGNLVLGQAIQSGVFVPSRYYMINPAVPIQAYDDTSSTSDMVEEDWVNIDPSYYASNWHQEFSGGDARGGLRWIGAFSGVTEIEAHNFYSPGEEVLAKFVGMDSASVLELLTTIGIGDAFDGHGAWKAQELVKGKNGFESLASFVMERSQAGWRLNGDYTAGDDIKQIPRFHPFLETDLHDADPATASTKADQSDPNVRFDLLARGLPSLSYAAAVDQIDNTSIQNFNMETSGRVPGQWPTEQHSGDAAGNWLHSDFRNVALPYTYPMYLEMISLGGLDEN